MNKKALTLPEVLIAAGILVLTISGILFSYIACLELTELSKNSSFAVRAAKARLEEIKNIPFDNITATYNNVSFNPSNLNGKGVSYVDNSNPNLLLVAVTVCWRQPRGRIIGEDTNLNGQLDAGEDKNGNGILDSIVQLTSYIYRRE